MKGVHKGSTRCVYMVGCMGVGCLRSDNFQHEIRMFIVASPTVRRGGCALDSDSIDHFAEREQGKRGKEGGTRTVGGEGKHHHGVVSHTSYIDYMRV